MRKLLQKFKELQTGESVILIGLLLMAIGLSTSRFLMSISFLFTGFGWFLITNRLDRFKSYFSSWNPALVFNLCYGLMLLSLLWTNDFAYAWKDVKVKMPLLFLPYILYTSPKLSRFWFLTIIKAFILATLVSCLSALINYLRFKLGFMTTELLDMRQISMFIDHIRLSLMIALSSLFLIFKGHEFKWRQSFVYALIIFFIAFLVFTQYFTGLTALLFGLISILIIRRKHLPKIWGLSLWFTLLSGVLIITFLGFREYKHTFTIDENEVNTFLKESRDHNPLEFVKEDLSCENGYYIYRNIQKYELNEEWKRRSSIPMNGKDLAGNELYYTLIRFISSKGEIKDGKSVRELSQSEVEAIEKGIPNSRYLEISGFAKRINQIMYQFKWYFEGGNPSGHSLTQRLEFLKTGWDIFKEQPLLGVGIGDLKSAFTKEYAKGNSKLDEEYQKRTHNQFATFFITYGIIGGSALMLFFLLSIKMNSLRTSLYFLSFMMVFLVSCLNEDTLETQAGVSFFGFFFSVLMFARKPKI